MPFFSRKKQPLPVCTWSAHAAQSGSSPSPFPRCGHTLTATATAAGELFLFGGRVGDSRSSDLYAFSTRDFSTTLLQTSGEVPAPRAGHGAALIGTTLLICGGLDDDKNVLNHDSLYLLNLGTLDLLMSSPTQADHSLRSSIARVDSRCGQWSRTEPSLLLYQERGRFQALRLRW
jgi:Galactose oxidase, central domain